ncbi:MAG: hypothetical protein V4712_15205 [Pseudomonadota bacterium]
MPLYPLFCCGYSYLIDKKEEKSLKSHNGTHNVSNADRCGLGMVAAKALKSLETIKIFGVYHAS